MAKKMGLGRGLSAILPDVEEVVESVDQVSETPAPVPADAVVELSVGDIDPNRNQPRKKFDDDALLAYLKASDNEDMIQTTEKPKWGEFKKRLEIVGGQIVDKTTGELVEGVQIIEKPDTFTVDV